MTNLQFLDDMSLSSSTESTNGIPFANENIGTIKQRSLLNRQETYDTMKRSLPMEFFQQSPKAVPIYDNNEEMIRRDTPSPIKKSSLATNGHDLSVSTIDKRSHYIEAFNKDKQNRTIR